VHGLPEPASILDDYGIVQAIAAGKYPSPPARDLHFVCRGNPEKKHVRAFIKWVLTEGQGYVPESGYIKIPEGKLQNELKHLESQ